MELVQTSAGAVGLLPPRRASGPVRLVIGGSFHARDPAAGMEMPGYDCATAYMPTFWAPALSSHDPEAIAAAYDEALAPYAERPTLLICLSAGFAVATLMNLPNVRCFLAIEPFLSTEGLWPLSNFVARDGPEAWHRQFSGAFFRFPEGRRYRLGAVPDVALVGDEPLNPPRPLRRMPSLTSDGDRRFLAAQGCQIVVGAGGHGVAASDSDALRRALALADRQFTAPLQPGGAGQAG